MGSPSLKGKIRVWESLTQLWTPIISRISLSGGVCDKGQGGRARKLSGMNAEWASGPELPFAFNACIEPMNWKRIVVRTTYFFNGPYITFMNGGGGETVLDLDGAWGGYWALTCFGPVCKIAKKRVIGKIGANFSIPSLFQKEKKPFDVPGQLTRSIQFLSNFQNSSHYHHNVVFNKNMIAHNPLAVQLQSILKRNTFEINFPALYATTLSKLAISTPISRRGC